MSEIYVAGRRIESLDHVVNEHATNAKAMTHTRNMIIEGLPFLQHNTISTSLKPEDTVKEIHYYARSHGAQIGYGGESTNNVMALAATSGPLIDLGSPQFYLPGGNKNDLSHELNIKDVAKHPLSAIYSAVLKEIYPVEVYTHKERCLMTTRRVAMAYTSLGLTAEISKQLLLKRDAPIAKLMRKNKVSRSIVESLWTLEGLAKARSFEIEDHNDHNEVKRLVELGYINISRMAGNIVITSVLADDLLAVRLESSNKAALVAELAAWQLVYAREK